MNKNIYRNYPIDPEDEDYGYGASVYDCTGLIPSEPQSEEELESYEDIYPYLPPEDDQELD
ncbi:MAG: hypothetical protein J1E41_00120 [Ruminococcus sp.]|nr:hypothetical protein [Ruminococcus sp.]